MNGNYKNRHARRACVYRWRIQKVLLARYKCWRCNKTECSKRCAIFVVYIADLEIFDCRYFLLTIVRKVELVVKGRAWPYITNEGPSRGSITTYLQRWELNINDSVRKYYNRSDYLTGSRSNSKKILNYRQSVIVTIILTETRRPLRVNSGYLGLCM